MSSSGPHRLARRPVRSRPRSTNAAEPTASFPNRSRTESTASSSARRSSTAPPPSPSKSRRPCTAAPSSSCCTETPSSRMPSSRSTARSRPRAVSPISRARSVGVGSVWDRVIVRKSPYRSLSCTVRAVFAAAAQRATRPRRPCAARRARGRRGRCGPVANVSSCPIDFELPVRLDRTLVPVPGQGVQVGAGGLAERSDERRLRQARRGRRPSPRRTGPVCAGSPARPPTAA